jgi:hypothetical protein
MGMERLRRRREGSTHVRLNVTIVGMLGGFDGLADLMLLAL